MADFAKAIEEHKDLSLKDQKKAGKAIAGDMDDEHANFLNKLIKLLDKKEIDTKNPRSFINEAVYEAMPQTWKGKTDIALINIVLEVERIEEFFRSKETPNASPHLQTMIEHLWQMKERIEHPEEGEGYDVFKI